ncbi:MAG: ribose-phosphate diphosphokinase [Phycisphaerales bacterium]
MLLFSTESYTYMLEGLADSTGYATGQLERRTFTDGERYHRIVSGVDNKDVVLVGGTCSDRDTLELFDLACGLVQEGVRSLTLVLPYLGYATMDRAVKPGEVVKAKTRAKLISSIPHGVLANRIILLDLHAEGIQYYFEGPSHTVHVYAKPLVTEAIRTLGGEMYVLACTDAGRAKWVESLANELGVPASFVFKRRREDGHPEVTAMSADVEGQSVVIYDDMVRSGDSLMNAARAYRDAGAQRVTAVTTHGLFPGEAIQTIRGTGLIEAIVCTDSHPNARLAADNSEGFLSVRTVTPVLVQALARNKEPRS